MPEWQSWLFDLNDIVGKEHVLSRDPELAGLVNDGGARPRALVRPGKTSEVAKVLRFAQKYRIPVMQVGPVACGCPGGEHRTGWLALDLGRMTRLRHIEPKNLTCELEVGLTGEAVEKALREKGLSLGRIPDYLASAALGAWLAGRPLGPWPVASGRLSDLVLSLEGVLPDGTVFTSRATPRSAAGPDLDHALLGSEGALAVLTAATVAVRPLPTAQVCRGFRFPGPAAGLEVMRRVVQNGLNPAVAWLVDESVSRRLADHHRLEPEEAHGALLILAFEGTRPELVQFRAEAAFHQAQAAGAEELGEGTALEILKPGADQRRWAVELAVIWSGLNPLLQALQAAAQSLADLSTSFFPLGREAVGLRLSLLTRSEPKTEIPRDQEIWKKLLKAAVQTQAVIGHFRGWCQHLETLIMPQALRHLYLEVKQKLDPERLLNSHSVEPAP